MLDAAKVADCVLFVLSADEEISEHGEQCLTCLFAHGLPASVFCVQGLKNLPVKKQSDAKKLLQKQIEVRFPQEKIHNLDTNQEGLLLLRTIGQQKLKKIPLHSLRSHMLAEGVTFEMDSNSQSGTLKLTGYIRSRALSVNQLVHLPGWGDFQMSQIDTSPDPNPLNPKVVKKNVKEGDDVLMEEEESGVRMLAKADPALQASLQSEVEVDPMEGEQTWPTEEELAAAEEELTKREIKRVPKGTSDYQASWIVDSGDEQDEDEDEDTDDDEDDDLMEAESQDGGDSQNASEAEDDDSDGDDEHAEDAEMKHVQFADEEKYDKTIDIEEEMKMLEKYKEARQEEIFPDEVDTPQDVHARTRFQRYRGLKSFRTSPWDTKENLPLDYARIFQFQNFKHTKKRVLNDLNADGAMPGWYVTVYISAVPKAFMDTFTPGAPIVLYGLLPHEQKISVMNMLIKSNHNIVQPIKSKDRMVFHVGYRRFAACPIYSQHTNADKHKFERFLKNSTATVATVFAPIIFPPASVLVFRETADGTHKHVASGSVLSVNPDRIVLKRIVLSGHPFKINKKLAVIRYMFFNREDIKWFKPVELRTKYGRRGHIRDTLGTHGHMKCLFDKQLTSMDTVMLQLYKRIYPKWTYDPNIRSPHVTHTSTEDAAMDALAEELFD
eukprot:GHVU01076365.1.p1 GENE.GHVU01076365.1~~GHVU01076365.1.p1  ORF type:complete len:729 (-),score=121.62 GHVU01076365.1:308-2302(-)